jgi:hypothetical protein
MQTAAGNKRGMEAVTLYILQCLPCCCICLVILGPVYSHDEQPLLVMGTAVWWADRLVRVQMH